MYILFLNDSTKFMTFPTHTHRYKKVLCKDKECFAKLGVFLHNDYALREYCFLPNRERTYIHMYIIHIGTYIRIYRPVLSLDEKEMPATNIFLFFLITELSY